MENRDEMLRVGVISNTHGVHGEVKVYPTTDDAERFDYLKEVYLDLGQELKKLEVTSVKYFKNLVILKFKGIDTLNDVEKWKQKDLLVTRENAVPLKEGEYFISDIIGIHVFKDDDEANEIGILTDVMKMYSNDVYVVETKDKKEILIPAIKDCDIKISLDEKKMRVHMLPGLMDLN